jgi:hypothetical protein
LRTARFLPVPPIERESGQNSRTGVVAAGGNASETGHVGGGSGEEMSFLFHSSIALKSACTEIGPAQLVKHRTSRGVRTAPDGP